MTMMKGIRLGRIFRAKERAFWFLLTMKTEKLMEFVT